LSALGWAAFFLCAIAVAFHYMTVRNVTFLLYAIPGLIMLIAIPMALNWMSRKSFREASIEHSGKTRHYKIKQIDLAMTGSAVKISGTVRKVTFKWLNRPHFQVEDTTAQIRVIMFTSPSEDIQAGDEVEVLGLVMKNLFNRKIPIISAVSIHKID
jgi:RecJ-like exonuclease